MPTGGGTAFGARTEMGGCMVDKVRRGEGDTAGLPGAVRRREAHAALVPVTEGSVRAPAAGEMKSGELVAAMPEEIAEIARMQRDDTRLPVIEMMSGQMRRMHPRYLAAMLYVITEAESWRSACARAGCQHGSLLKAMRAPGYRGYLDELTVASLRMSRASAATQLNRLIHSEDEEVSVKAVKIALDSGSNSSSQSPGRGVNISINLQSMESVGPVIAEVGPPVNPTLK